MDDFNLHVKITGLKIGDVTLCCALNTHHVIPEGARHQRLSLLTEVEAVRTEVGAIRAAILPEVVSRHIITLLYKKEIFHLIYKVGLLPTWSLGTTMSLRNGWMTTVKSERVS